VRQLLREKEARENDLRENESRENERERNPRPVFSESDMAERKRNSTGREVLPA